MSRPLRVLFVANDPLGGTVTRYRCENLAVALRAAGHVAEVAYVGSPRVRVDHDVVVLHRICLNAEGRRYLRAARACGAAVVYGADDLVFEEAAFPADVSGLHARFRRYAPLHEAMLREADALLLSTEFLVERARGMLGEADTKPILLLRNFLSPEFETLAASARASVGPRDPDAAAVTVAYVSGSATHDGDLAFIADAVRDVLAARPHAELLLVGPVEPPAALAGGAVRLRRQGFVPWRDVPGVLARADLCLAPLELDVPLNHGKSEIKLLEAAAVGVPTIVSASAGFSEALRPRPDAGRLAVTPDDWRRYLAELVDDAAARARVAEAARGLLAAEGTEAAQRARIVDAFVRIAALPRPAPANGPRATVVHWPAAPPKYLAKKALARWKGLRRKASRR